jgi:uncharacterized protein (DUF488 family)
VIRREPQSGLLTLGLGTKAQSHPIYTVGHSTRPIDEFIRILRAHRIAQLIDVRTIPRSRHNPQFSKETLAVSLAAAGIEYRHMPGLGGLRQPKPGSMNTGWRNASFRGYADYMQTAEFRQNLDALIELSAAKPTAAMCAEAVPWRCHRSLLADALTARSVEVVEILSETKAQPHAMTPFACVEDGQVSYPGSRQPKNLELKFDSPAKA